MNDDDEIQVDDIGADIRSALAEKVADADVEITQPEAPRESERPRGPDGKFLPKESPVEPTAPEPITDADPAQAAIVPPSPVVDMPKTWSAEAKAEWSRLSPAVQQAVLKRESEMDAGGRQWSEQRRSLEQQLAPLHELSQQNGLPWQEGLNRLLTVESGLRNPATAPQMVATLAQAYGVDLAALVNGTQQPQRPAPQFDPNVIPQLVSQQVQERLQAWQQDQALTGEIQAFANERDATGLKHPHFSNEGVKQHMSALLDKGLASSLQDAYDKAVYAIPEIRSTLLSRPNPQIGKAKAAAISPRGAPNGTVPAKANGYDPKTSIEDDLRETIASLRH